MKKIIILLMAGLLVLGLAGCGAAKLPEGFSEEQVYAKALDCVELLSAGEYEELSSSVREELKASLSPQVLEEALGETLAAAGSFLEVKDKAAGSGGGSGEEFAVVVLECEFENASHTFTISLDKDLMIVGLYMK